MIRRWLHNLTLRTRLIITLAIGLSIVVTGTAMVSALAIDDFLESRVSNRMMASNRRLGIAINGLQDLTMSVDTVTQMARADSSAFVAVDAAGRPLLVLNADPKLAEKLLATPGLTDTTTRPVDGYPGVTASRLTAQGRLTIVDGNRTVRPDSVLFAVDANKELAKARRFVVLLALGMLGSIALLIVLTVAVVSRSLRPLRSMSQQAREFAAGDRAMRLTVPSDDPDINRLATSVNQAFDAQQRAESRLRAFVADASHELRTPLTTSSGWVELYLQGGLSDPDKRDQAMQRVESQLSRMRLLTDELSLLALLDRDRPLRKDPVDLTEMATELVEDARVMNPDRTFLVNADGPAALLGDAPKLQQVLLNLLGNAVQHTPAGTPVEITVVPAPDGSQHVLQVSDHGPGIASQDQPHIFERFWRGDASRNRHTGGSGLGLSIVSSIVAAHGGTSHVTSEPGEGTTITITLPPA